MTLLHWANDKVSVALEYKPRWLWLGLYWNKYTEMDYKMLALYICIIPVLPIHIGFSYGKF